jgi:hypothetical protein
MNCNGARNQKDCAGEGQQKWLDLDQDQDQVLAWIAKISKIKTRELSNKLARILKSV